ncbi:hypothetical protein [Cellulomonas xiejunii]|uniref:hypothetical protein n=1 Tax=Cellulomonas xiejunii TaxID=2968083 RepID=UPI001D0E84EE|nr:hypothetical protein [Cellulomonas xiejunii]MCC2315246.1 hypothetical protein [Cellulomonas xiejunii]
MRRPTPVPDPLLDTAARQEGLLSTAQCERAGLTRDRRAALGRAGELVPVVRGVHDAAPAVVRRHGPHVFAAPAPGGRPGADRGGAPTAPRDLDHLRRRAAWTALLALGPSRAVAVGCCALALHGVQGLPATIRPEAALPSADGRRPRGGGPVTGSVTRCFGTGDVVVVGGARAVVPELALAQAVCELGRDHAVAVLDSALQRGLVLAGDLGGVRARARGRRGAARLAEWWHLVDGRAQSPLETWARLQCVDAGIPPHDVQVPVRDRAGRVVARGDLGWIQRDGRLLVAEVDGAGPHSTPAALYEDRRRQNAIAAADAVLVRFTAEDIRARHVVPSTIRRHLR